jgi:DNA-directed RNA polymerase beta subunit
MPPSVLDNNSVLSAEPAKPAPTTPAPEPTAQGLPPNSREFGDHAATRQMIYKNVYHALNNLEPVANQRYSLSLHNVGWTDPEKITTAKRKEALMTGKTLARRIGGTWRLTDATTGQVADERNATVAAVPYLTRSGTFVVNGSEITMSHQQRLEPGIFTRLKENGELEAHINVLPGQGASHRYFLDPETGVFKINIGQAKLPLLPVLRAMGTTDKELRDHWGNEIYSANQQADDPRVIGKLYGRIVRGKKEATDPEDQRKAVAETMAKMRLDPEITKRTLGNPFDTLSKEAILATTNKLIRVGRGEAETDDRDHLAYQRFLGPEDVLAERFGKDKSVLRQMLWKATNQGNLQKVPSGLLTRQLHAALVHTGLGQSAEEINPAELLDAAGRATRLGEGGIPSIDAIPDEARNVQPSHFGFIDPVRTPESFRVGVDTRMTSAARKGSDGRVYAPFINAKTGKTEYRSPQQLADATIAFPKEDMSQPFVFAMRGGREQYVPREELDYVQPHFEHAFSPLANMIPGKSGIKAQRMAMGSRYLAQALPLLAREAPLLQSAIPGTNSEKSYEDHYGTQMGAERAKGPGRVLKITPDAITVKYDDGTKEEHELYNNFPYARKTFIHNTPAVGVGDRVDKDQLLAGSNFTDDKGTTALGTNPYIAFLPYDGHNYEDSIVISESYGKKRLASEHMYRNDVEWQPTMRKGKANYAAMFPGTYDRQTLDTMDEHGVVKPGTEIKFGDPMILVAQEREQSHSKIHRGRGPSYADNSITWDHHSPGVVTDVYHTPKGVSVAVKSVNPMEVGDKLSNRYGGKGVVSKIVPDDEMPTDSEGKPFDMMLSPEGLPSRINPVQVTEMQLAKVAKKRGAPYKLEDFNNIPDLRKYAEDELQKYGVKDLDTVTDPRTGRKIPNVQTGYQFMMKLHHTSESKGQGRSLGSYTAEEVPAKGGPEGSKRLALLETNALLSHGATEVLRDAHLIRGQKNDDYWSAYMSGFRPPEPRVPHVYQKFVDHLKGSGINVVRNGGQTNVMALTPKDVNALSGSRELENVETVDWKEGLKPRRGGLFDPELTGGHGGNRWSFIKLHEPLPNPAFEEPIRRLLGLTEDKFMKILSGQDDLNGIKGPKAIQEALGRINIPKAIEQARTDIAGSRKTVRDVANRKLKYLMDAQRLGIHPKEWILDKVPVLPPMFRPVSVMQGSGNQLVSDANYLYKELFDANHALKEMSGKVADVSEERSNAYNAFKAVTGLGDPTHPKNQERRVKGLLQHVFGTAPKFGMVQRQLLSATVDVVGRAVITPNADLDMDQVGIPETKAWEVYRPFIVRSLVHHGVPRMEALEMVQRKHPMARQAILQEMEQRPVIISRAPVLHRYGIMAFKPVMVKGDVMQVSPLVTKGFNADFDGDTLNYHVPASDEAKDEALHKLLPSRNLFAVSDFKAHYVPGMEFQGGLYAATKFKKEAKRPHVFATKADMIDAYHRGELDVDDPVEIVHH